MLFDMVVRETIEKALHSLDDVINKDNAQQILDKLDEWQNHKLLQENRAYIVTKIDNEIQLIYTNNQHIEISENPITIDLTVILNTVRKKCYKALGDMPNLALLEG